MTPLTWSLTLCLLSTHGVSHGIGAVDGKYSLFQPIQELNKKYSKVLFFCSDRLELCTKTEQKISCKRTFNLIWVSRDRSARFLYSDSRIIIHHVQRGVSATDQNSLCMLPNEKILKIVPPFAGKNIDATNCQFVIVRALK
jgi:hypothetical protein